MDPNEIAKVIVEELLTEIELREYVKKHEWDIYRDIEEFRGKKVPKVYSEITM